MISINPNPVITSQMVGIIQAVLRNAWAGIPGPTEADVVERSQSFVQEHLDANAPPIIYTPKQLAADPDFRVSAGATVHKYPNGHENFSTMYDRLIVMSGGVPPPPGTPIPGGSGLTDQLITGVPNWALYAGGAGLLLFLWSKRK